MSQPAATQPHAEQTAQEGRHTGASESRMDWRPVLPKARPSVDTGSNPAATTTQLRRIAYL